MTSKLRLAEEIAREMVREGSHVVSIDDGTEQVWFNYTHEGVRGKAIDGSVRILARLIEQSRSDGAVAVLDDIAAKCETAGATTAALMLRARIGAAATSGWVCRLPVSITPEQAKAIAADALAVSAEVKAAIASANREGNEVRAEAAALRDELASLRAMSTNSWREEAPGMRIEKRADGEWLVGVTGEPNDCEDKSDGGDVCTRHLNGEHLSCGVMADDGAIKIDARWPIAPTHPPEPDPLVEHLIAAVKRDERSAVERAHADGVVDGLRRASVIMRDRGGSDSFALDLLNAFDRAARNEVPGGFAPADRQLQEFDALREVLVEIVDAAKLATGHAPTDPEDQIAARGRWAWRTMAAAIARLRSVEEEAVADRDAAYQRGQEEMRERAAHIAVESSSPYVATRIRSIQIAKTPTVSASEEPGEVDPGRGGTETAGVGESVARDAGDVAMEIEKLREQVEARIAIERRAVDEAVGQAVDERDAEIGRLRREVDRLDNRASNAVSQIERWQEVTDCMTPEQAEEERIDLRLRCKNAEETESVVRADRDAAVKEIDRLRREVASVVAAHAAESDALVKATGATSPDDAATDAERDGDTWEKQRVEIDGLRAELSQWRAATGCATPALAAEATRQTKAAVDALAAAGYPIDLCGSLESAAQRAMAFLGGLRAMVQEHGAQVTEWRHATGCGTPEEARERADRFRQIAKLLRD